MTDALNPEQRRELEELFERVVGLSCEERECYLDHACPPSSLLRCELDALLDADPGATFMRSPIAPESKLDRDRSEALGKPLVDGFTIERRLGEGGMGIVFEATQAKPHRRVALKIVRAGLNSSELNRRFEQEGMVLARLQHPAIAMIYEVGHCDLPTGERLPYLAMELIANACAITDFASERKLTTRQRLETFAQVCDGIEHAHQRGILHRDLKPTNLLVDAEGRPHIIDFGIARIVDQDESTQAHHTRTGQVLGTPLYMSPEQFDAKPHVVGPATDIYALGVVLFELLAGELPHELEGRSIVECARIVQGQPATLLGAKDTNYRGDLEVIVSTALARDPGDRFKSVAEFAADIRRYLRGEPIEARRPSTFYQLRMFTKRNQTLVLAVLAILISSLAGTSVSVSYAIESENNLGQQQIALRRANGQRLCAQAQAIASDSPVQGLQLAIAGTELGATTLQSNRALYRAIDQAKEVATLSGHEHIINIISVSPDGKWITSCDRSGLQILWDVENRSLRHRWDEHAVWTREQGKHLLGAQSGMFSIVAAGFSPDSLTAFSAGVDGMLHLWGVVDGQSRNILKHPDAVLCAVIGPENKKVYTGCADGWVRVFDLSRGVLEKKLVQHDRPVRVLVRGENTLVSAGFGEKVWVMALGSSKPPMAIARPVRYSEPWQGNHARLLEATRVDISRDGSRVLVGSKCGIAAVFDSEDGVLLKSYDENQEVSRPYRSPAGDWIYLGAVEGFRGHMIINTRTDEKTIIAKDVFGMVAVRFSPDGRTLALGETLIDLPTGTVRTRLRGPKVKSRLTWLNDTGLVSAEGCLLRLWDISGDHRLRALEGHLVALDPSGLRGLVLAETHMMAKPSELAPPGIVDLATGETVTALPGLGNVRVANYGPRGRYLYTFESRRDNPRDMNMPRVTVWDLEERRPVMRLASAEPGRAGISRSGLVAMRLAVKDEYPKTIIQIFDLKTGEVVFGGDKAVKRMFLNPQFSPDSHRLVTANGDEHVATVWQVSSGALLHTFHGFNSFCMDAKFSPDGKSVALACTDSVLIYDAYSYELRRQIHGLSGEGRLSWSPDSRHLAFSSRTGTALCDAVSGGLLMQWPEHHPILNGYVRFTAEQMIIMTSPGVVQLIALDPLQRARELLSREISAADMDRFNIGSKADRIQRRRQELGGLNTCAGYASLAQLDLDAGAEAAAFALLEQASKLRPNGIKDRRYFIVLARALCRRATREDSPDMSLEAAQDALREAIRYGARPVAIEDDPAFAALRTIPSFVDWLRSLRRG